MRYTRHNKWLREVIVTIPNRLWINTPRKVRRIFKTILRTRQFHKVRGEWKFYRKSRSSWTVLLTHCKQYIIILKQILYFDCSATVGLVCNRRLNRARRKNKSKITFIFYLTLKLNTRERFQRHTNGPQMLQCRHPERYPR